MKRALLKDLLREVYISWVRFVSIFAIVLIGVAFFAGIKATAPDMKHTADKYYDDYNMNDIRIISTLGLTEDDIESIKNIDSVKHVQSGYFTDIISILNSSELVFRVHSIPKTIEENTINQVKIIEGRYPENPGECIIEKSQYLDTGLDIGDTLIVASGKSTPITDDVLATDEFKIVGMAETPYYLSYEKGPSDIGNGSVTFFMMILEEDFIYPVYTEALITVEGAKELSTYYEEYEKAVERVAVKLENLGIDRSNIRISELKDAAQAKLDEAKAEYDAAKAEFDEKIGEAEDELTQARIDLEKGESELELNKRNFEEQTAMAEEQLATYREQLIEGESEYRQGVRDYNQLQEDYAEDLESLDNAVTEMNEYRDQVQANRDDLETQLENPDLTDQERENIQTLIDDYDELLVTLDSGVDSANNLNDLGQSQLENAEAELAEARRELDQGWADLHEAENELEESKEQAAEEFAVAEQELADGWEEYDEGMAELEAQRSEGQAELDKGMEEIIHAEDEIERLSGAQWYVLDRSYNYSYVDYGMTADRVDAIAKVFPAFFFLVAALVCLTTMARMVDEQRGSIGTFKALGYSNKDIAIKYVVYAAIASALGAIAGLFIGMKIFPEVIYKSWMMKYTLPPLLRIRQIPLSVFSVSMGILVTTLTSFIACNKELREVPALLMRPKAPKAGKKILLERIKFIWKKLTFSQKVTARNLLRYKKRFFMTIIGIAGCSALLLAGFGLSDSIGQIVNKQYNEIFSYDLLMKFSNNSDAEGMESVISSLEQNDKVKSFIPGTEMNAKVRNEEDDISATLMVAPDTQSFAEYVALRTSSKQELLDLNKNGVIISEKLAKELGVGIGDSIEMDNGLGARKKVEISGITENYVFHYVYINQDYYTEIYRLSPETNHLLIKLNDTSNEAENELASELIADENVSSVTFYSSVAKTFDETVKGLNEIVLVIIICAGLLAFVVLYNLTNINISERIREIATIKVLGFFNNEVSAYVFRENVILSLLGALIGLALGIILHRFIMVSIEQQGIMFGNYINNISFLYAFVITQVFTGLVSLFMYRRLKSIPMVESLKSIE